VICKHSPKLKGWAQDSKLIWSLGSQWRNIPAHQALLTDINLSLGRRLSPDWRCPPGHPPNRWLDQILTDTGSPQRRPGETPYEEVIFWEWRNGPSWLCDNDDDDDDDNDDDDDDDAGDWVINQAVDCRYFSPGPWLPFQPQASLPLTSTITSSSSSSYDICSVPITN